MVLINDPYFYCTDFTNVFGLCTKLASVFLQQTSYYFAYCYYIYWFVLMAYFLPLIFSKKDDVWYLNHESVRQITLAKFPSPGPAAPLFSATPAWHERSGKKIQESWISALPISSQNHLELCEMGSGKFIGGFGSNIMDKGLEMKQSCVCGRNTSCCDSCERAHEPHGLKLHQQSPQTISKRSLQKIMSSWQSVTWQRNFPKTSLENCRSFPAPRLCCEQGKAKSLSKCFCY